MSSQPRDSKFSLSKTGNFVAVQLLNEAAKTMADVEEL